MKRILAHESNSHSHASDPNRKQPRTRSPRRALAAAAATTLLLGACAAPESTGSAKAINRTGVTAPSPELTGLKEQATTQRRQLEALHKSTAMQVESMVGKVGSLTDGQQERLGISVVTQTDDEGRVLSKSLKQFAKPDQDGTERSWSLYVKYDQDGSINSVGGSNGARQFNVGQHLDTSGVGVTAPDAEGMVTVASVGYRGGRYNLLPHASTEDYVYSAQIGESNQAEQSLQGNELVVEQFTNLLDGVIDHFDTVFTS